MIHQNRKNTMETKTVILVTISLLITRTSGIDDVPEFQYPCYVDVCSFPRQFCNSDERRCSPCSRAICHSPRVPTACRYICIKYNEVTTTPTTTAIWTTKQHDDGVRPFSSLHLLMIYSVVATSVLIVIISLAIGCYCRRKQMLNTDSDRENTRKHYLRVARDKPADFVVDSEQKSETQPPHVCPTCGEMRRQRPSPETHRTNIGPETNMSNSSLPSYKSHDPRQNIRPHPPLVDTPSDSTESEKLLVTNKSRACGSNEEVIVANASTDDHDSMHEKPWTDSTLSDLTMQQSLMNDIQRNSGSENTLLKSRNG